MEVILNDLSLNDKFENITDFEEYFLQYIKKVIKIIIEEQIPFYKKTDTYNRRIASGIVLGQYLREAANQTVATLIKQAIVEMAYAQPYWDTEDNILSNTNTFYAYPDKCEEPNCYTEAIERNCLLLSVQENERVLIECRRNNEYINITSVKESKGFLDEYLKSDISKVRYIIEHYPFDKEVICADVSGKCYTEEALMYNHLTNQDIHKFVININNLITDKSSGRKTHWWDSIKDDICEYRISVSDGRELRVLLQWGEKIILMNGFIKKTDKTPKEQIELAEKIKKNNI